MIVLIIHRTQRGIAAQFAYPARTGYTTLTKADNDYYAIMTEEETLAARSGPHNVEVKLFMADDTRPIGIAEMEDLDSSQVGKIEES